MPFLIICFRAMSNSSTSLPQQDHKTDTKFTKRRVQYEPNSPPLFRFNDLILDIYFFWSTLDDFPLLSSGTGPTKLLNPNRVNDDF